MANISSVNKSIGKAFNYTATKWLPKTLEKARKEPVKYAAKIMVLSFISKDVINTCFYTYQSLNNKKIPKEKRSFVAANDLVLGFFNFFGQIFSFALFEKKIIPVIEGKHFTGLLKKPDGSSVYKFSDAKFAPDRLHNYTSDVIGEKGDVLKGIKPENIKEISEDVVKKLGKGGSKYGDVLAGLGIVIGALSTNALVKRTLSPLFSTPIAGWLGNKWDKKAEERERHNASLQAQFEIEESQVLNNIPKDNRIKKDK